MVVIDQAWTIRRNKVKEETKTIKGSVKSVKEEKFMESQGYRSASFG